MSVEQTMRLQNDNYLLNAKYFKLYPEKEKEKGEYLIIRVNVSQIIGCLSISFCTFLYIILHILIHPAVFTHLSRQTYIYTFI